MAIHFETHSIPNALTGDIEVPNEATTKISKRLTKTNRKLVKKMKVIDRKEKRSWQKSLLRN
ncbi:MAG TPA: hypothetical protein IAC96_10210 [Candidatus Fimimorpha faecalis]|uniref:Uncharacterized protein n=1 Tax=Candidatus Fimimorpha faecalis TaxID=2840824 RepID=A0A9D1EG69_9FIRM|nr:hypothetical protein [Candidatus Fimimorpha faecalis]